MNYYTMLAIMELKGLISNDEALRVRDKLANTIAPSNYAEALERVKPLLDILGV